MALDAQAPRPAGRVKKDPKSMTLNVRMGETTYEWLEREAEKRGLSVSALARMFIIQKLDEVGGQPPYESIVMTGGEA